METEAEGLQFSVGDSQITRRTRLKKETLSNDFQTGYRKEAITKYVPHVVDGDVLGDVFDVKHRRCLAWRVVLQEVRTRAGLLHALRC